ncbi:MAG TPA: 2-oxo-4-hydroxy-4-carboxy-5-ureidoimidazoline decarboxylase [Solirubrobacteraceae bacterium]|jgi:OHCU decarboxylase|nr:2-oxo-4-hydroxy-4-carboxy-5-ureidoimidazoline decarboxylase [Solirubrobacteraceae bacterium]
MRLSAETLRACCGSRRWVELMSVSTPSVGGAEGLLAASNRAFDVLGRADWLEAFAAHSAIGAPRDGDLTGASEQAGVQGDQSIRAVLAAATLEYQRRFGFVFLIRAAGRSGAEILAALNDRLDNTTETEFQNACDQQREITALRMARLLPS